MKKWWLFAVIVFCVFKADAQNNFFFGHYMFNPSYFNPGWNGSQEVGFAAVQHRSQWLGYSTSFDGSGGAPVTQMITGLAPVQDFFVSSVGLNLSYDQLGPVKNLQAQLPLSFSKEFRAGRISVGVAPGIFSQTQDFSELNPNDPDDLLIPDLGSQTNTKADLSAGVFFKADAGFFIGASAINILEPGFSYGIQRLENVRKRSYALHGGTEFSIGDELILSPVFLVRSDLTRFTFDAGAIVTLRDKMWGGISYRRKESAILYLGYSMLPGNKLKVGYSFDYILKSREGKAATSHEIFIRYDLPDLVFGGRKSVKTPRFSY